MSAFLLGSVMPIKWKVSKILGSLSGLDVNQDHVKEIHGFFFFYKKNSCIWEELSSKVVVQHGLY